MNTDITDIIKKYFSAAMDVYDKENFSYWDIKILQLQLIDLVNYFQNIPIEFSNSTSLLSAK